MCNDKTAPRRRHLISFGLRTLFVVVTCVAAYFAGHRTGFHAGYTKASEEYGVEGLYGYYDVSDFVIPLPEDVRANMMGGMGHDASNSGLNR